MKASGTASGRSDSASESGPADARAIVEPMTDDQINHLKVLSEQALEPEAFHSGLSKSEAARRIAALQAKLPLLDGPPHPL
jgi:hypothetical protein